VLKCLGLGLGEVVDEVVVAEAMEAEVVEEVMAAVVEEEEATVVVVAVEAVVSPKITKIMSTLRLPPAHKHLCKLHAFSKN